MPPLNPVLAEVPEHMKIQARLVLRPPRRGDGPALNATILASRERLALWMPWAAVVPTVADSEAYCRRQHARFLLREDLTFLIVGRDARGGEGDIVGATGLHRPDWSVRTFEIGYWLREGCEGRGLMTEAVGAIAAMAFDAIGAQRVEIRCDAVNRRSQAVAERAGFVLEGVLRRDSATPTGAPRDTRIYARVGEDREAPEAPAALDRVNPEP